MFSAQGYKTTTTINVLKISTHCSFLFSFFFYKILINAVATQEHMS